ncbi:MAG: LysM peptidoglycan-binding domain-containing protein [Anaerolineales bacterium]
MNLRRRFLSALSLLALAVMMASPVLAIETPRPVVQEPGTNLLKNPGFEGIGRPVNNSSPNSNNWTRDTFTGTPYGEIFTPEGWVTWWQEGEFKRPECKVVPNEHPFSADPVRIYDGYYSGMCFTFFGKQNAGYFQVVRDIPPGSVVEGSFYAHAWACGEDDNGALSCAEPHAFYFQVGIDPNGGTDPFSSNVVWSDPYYHYDKFGLVGPVQATVGEAGAATLFMRAYGKWQLKHNDAYMDNASLKLTSTGETPTPTSPPPPPTSEAPPTPQFTPTPRPDGAVVHIVETGDTLFGIALAYNVDLDELRRLNAGTLGPNDLLSIGQEVIISGSPSAVSPTETPEPAQESEPTEPPTGENPPETQAPGNGEQQTPAPTGTGDGNSASLCVLAFQDMNNDGFYQSEEGEMALPNAEFNLVGTSGPVGSYTTDGISEPYCFQNLEPGNYVLRHNAPSGYTTDIGPWNVSLGAGQTSSIEIGYVRGEAASPDAETTPSPNASPDDEETLPPVEGEGETETDGVTQLLNTVLRVSGIVVLLLAIALGGLFFLSRRSI